MLDEGNSMVTDTLELRVVRLALYYFLINLLCVIILCLVVKGRQTSQEHVCDNTKRPYVDFVVVSKTLAELRRHIHGTAEGERMFFLAIGVKLSRKAKIS